MRKRAANYLWAVALLLLSSGGAQAQTADLTETGPKAVKEESKKISPLPSTDITCEQQKLFGGIKLEKAAFCYLRKAEYASARALSEAVLKKDRESVRAHYILGAVQHYGEANLLKALHHLQRAERYFDLENPGEIKKGESAWIVGYYLLRALVWLHGEMDHHKEKIHYAQRIGKRIKVDYRPVTAWPLLKLKRFKEARAAIEPYLNEEKVTWRRAVALTALCAIESEMRQRQAAYEACKKAAADIASDPNDGAVELSNAGAASQEVFRFDEAEQFYTQATLRPPRSSVNPWGRLVRLYLAQGRFGEALSGWRKMREYRASRPEPYMSQQDEAEAILIGAAVLLVAGKSEEALLFTRRVVQQPDRQGTSSASKEQNEGGAALMDQAVKREVARKLEERASISGIGASIQLRSRAWWLRIKAWMAGRRVVQALADRERLISSVRPECPGSLELPSWLDVELAQVLDPSVLLRALAEAKAVESLPKEPTAGIFASFASEAYLRQGKLELALEEALLAVRQLPQKSVLRRARAAAVAGHIYWQQGKVERALRYFHQALNKDPGVIRRLGLSIPVRIQAEARPVAQEAVERLEGSPLFEISPAGFTLLVSRRSVQLRLPDGTSILQSNLKKQELEDQTPPDIYLADQVQSQLLVPRIDITQADIRSLDGGMGLGGKAAERVDSYLQEIIEGRQ